MSIFAKAQNSWVAVVLKKLFRAKIINPENEPDDTGAYIVCANHSSNWDPVLIGACMHRPLRYMAKSELFKIPVLKTIIKQFGAYPVNRGKADVSSIKTAINLLENGESVGMYPQGARVRGVHPKDVAPKNGAAMIALRAKVGVLPVTVISKKHKMRMFHRTIVVFGKYITYDELAADAGQREINGMINNVNDVNDGGGVPPINRNMDLYKKATDKIYGEIVANYDRYDTLN